jgi:hypothetical protein
MSVAMQRLVEFISMVINSTLLRNNTGASSLTLQLWAVTEEEQIEQVQLKLSAVIIYM